MPVVTRKLELKSQNFKEQYRSMITYRLILNTHYSEMRNRRDLATCGDVKTVDDGFREVKFRLRQTS